VVIDVDGSIMADEFLLLHYSEYKVFGKYTYIEITI